MPSITGYVDEEREEFIKEQLVENGGYDDVSDVVNECIRYTLDNKHSYSE